MAGFADGMGLGMKLIELDGRRGRSIRLASEMGLANNDRAKTEAVVPAGTRALQWGVNARLKAE
jgi:hypothetical protein